MNMSTKQELIQWIEKNLEDDVDVQFQLVSPRRVLRLPDIRTGAIDSPRPFMLREADYAAKVQISCIGRMREDQK